MKKIFKTGSPYIWLSGGTLTISLLMIFGLVTLIMIKGLGIFWPHNITRLMLDDNSIVLGEISKTEPIPNLKDSYRTKLKVGNRDIYGMDFRWVDNSRIISQDSPISALTIERREWGNMYGFLKGMKHDDTIVPINLADLKPLLKESIALYKSIRHIEKKEIGKINHKMEKLRLALKGLESEPQNDKDIEYINTKVDSLEKLYTEKVDTLTNLYASTKEKDVVIELADGREETLSIFQIIRIYNPNRMGIYAKSRFYVLKFWEFVSAEPREANTEGGVFPAIFGTVIMVLIMSLVVTPLGVITAVFLREYTSDNIFSRIVRISVNNLAGVPSIVFGVFGLGFFIYFIGGGIDKMFYSDALPSPTFGTGGILWASLTLALLTVPVVVVATEEGISSVPNSLKEASYGLGATKFETLWRITLPQATPGILTGMILAMARAAGEVAPLMITGVVKLAP
ncbi:MAG: phosphate ABC transporter permease PstA, partial [Candidatus Scalindua sp.]|nr:phosphate ABC transporter permease PstA [Candidatus Scalindua sp.]